MLADSKAASSIAEAANDPANVAAGWRVTLPAGIKASTVAKFRAASLALDAVIAAWGTPERELAPPLDRDCWPHSEAMNGAEIDRFMERLALFTRKGLTLADAEKLADKLVQGDREGDERKCCPECASYRRGRCMRGLAVVAAPMRCESFVDALQG